MVVSFLGKKGTSVDDVCLPDGLFQKGPPRVSKCGLCVSITDGAVKDVVLYCNFGEHDTSRNN